MKKLVCFILLYLTITPFAFAEETASTSTANAQSNFNYIINDNSKFESQESPIVTSLAPNANVPNLYRNQTEMKTSLDQDNNTKFLTSLMFKNKIKLNIVKAYSYSHFFNKAISTGEIAIDRSNDFIEFLPEIPVGDDVWPTAHRRNVKKEGDESFDRVICTALEEAYEKSDNSRYFTIKYEICDFSQVSNKGIGAGATFTKDIGGSTALSSGVTVGASSAKGNVFKGGYYEITFWNRGKSALVSSAPKVDKKPSRNLDLTEIESKEVFFAFDSYKIIDPKQIAAIEFNIQLIAEKINKLGPGKKIYVIGGTSEEGTDDHNIKLGKNRAETVAKLYSQGLMSLGISEDVILNKLRYVSMGEVFPNYQKLESNRRVWLLIGNKM